MPSHDAAAAGAVAAGAFMFLLWVGQLLASVLFTLGWATLRAAGRDPEAAARATRFLMGAWGASFVLALPWFVGVTWVFWGPTWPLLLVMLYVAPVLTVGATVWAVTRYVRGPPPGAELVEAP